jgi:pimeloyl-ACP methyl ester carboxylesterase
MIIPEKRRSIGPDGIAIDYWVSRDRSTTKDTYVLHPACALNHTSLARIEHALNERGHPTLSFDPRGSGTSDHPIARRCYHLPHLTDDLVSILRKESVESPIIVTHSFGFMSAIDYSLREDVKRIIGICASHNFKETAPNRFLFHLFDKGIIYSEYVGSAMTSVMNAMTGTERGEQDMSAPSSELALWWQIVDITIPQAASHVIGQREVNTWDITRQLGRTKTPLTLIHGTKDQMVTPIAAAAIRERTTAPCDMYLLEGTHALPMQRPEAIISLLRY